MYEVILEMLQQNILETKQQTCRGVFLEQVVWILCFVFCFIVLCALSWWGHGFFSLQMLEWKKNDISIVAGEITLLAGLLLWIATIPRIRRTYFELFYYAHHLYILFIVFFIFHVGISYALIMLPGFYLFMVDRYLRFLQSRRQVRLVSARVLPCEAVELNFSKGHGN